MIDLDTAPGTLKALREKIEDILQQDGLFVDGATGEILTVQDMNTLEAAWSDKVEATACVIKDLRKLADARKARAKELAAMANADASRADWLESYLCAMLDGKPFNSKDTKITWRKSEAVSVIDEMKIPPEFMRFKTTSAPDKTAIKAAIKAGQTVAGAELIAKNNMSIK